MIRGLQKKFIAITMGCLAFVTVVLIAAVNIANFIRVDGLASDLLEMVSTQRFPQGTTPPDGKPRGDREDGSFFGPHGGFYSPDENPEAAFTTRWFSVTLINGEVSRVSVEKIAAVTEADAVSYAKAALSTSKVEGYRGFYKYRVTERGDGQTVWFLDCGEDLRGAISLLFFTICISVVFLLLFFILVSLLSRRAVSPVLKNIERQKRFITDAGHELKTPLAIISANTDVLSLEGENEWVESIRQQTHRMEHLVQDLLTLSKAEETVPLSSREEFDLSDAVLDTATPFRSIAQTRGKTVRLQIAPEIRYRGDEGELRRLVSILMENALKYASAGGEIFLSLRREGKRVVLTQSNPCDRLPDRSQLQHLFDRFYRADPSRSRESGGYGIGLSIAQGIVTAHKGKISVSADGENTIRFTVIL